MLFLIVPKTRAAEKRFFACSSVFLLSKWQLLRYTVEEKRYQSGKEEGSG